MSLAGSRPTTGVRVAEGLCDEGPRVRDMIHLRLKIEGLSVLLVTPCGSNERAAKRPESEAEVSSRGDSLLSSNSSEHVGDVTCVVCLAFAERLGAEYAAAKRNGSVRSERAGTVLEELDDDGRWRFFDLRRWLRKEPSEYAPKLRVRRSVGSVAAGGGRRP